MPKYVCEFLKFIFSNCWKCILVYLHFEIEYIQDIQDTKMYHTFQSKQKRQIIFSDSSFSPSVFPSRSLVFQT